MLLVRNIHHALFDLFTLIPSNLGRGKNTKRKRSKKIVETPHPSSSFNSSPSHVYCLWRYFYYEQPLSHLGTEGCALSVGARNEWKNSQSPLFPFLLHTVFALMDGIHRIGGKGNTSQLSCLPPSPGSRMRMPRAQFISSTLSLLALVFMHSISYFIFVQRFSVHNHHDKPRKMKK